MGGGGHSSLLSSSSRSLMATEMATEAVLVIDIVNDFITGALECERCPGRRGPCRLRARRPPPVRYSKWTCGANMQ